MAKVGLFDTPPRKKFQYDEDTEVLIEYISKARVNTILMKGAEAAKKVKATTSSLQDIFLGKSAVHGWNLIGDETKPGFALPDGTPLSFNPANRNLMMTKSQKFSEFVYRICTDETKFLETDSLLEGEDLQGLEELLDDLEKTADVTPEEDLGNV